MVFQEEERHALLPWDGVPYEIADWRTVKVHPDHHVQCQLIKVYQRQPEGGRSTDADDYPATVSRYTTRAPDHIKGEAAKLGPAVDQFAQRLFEGPLPWARIRQGHKLLRLGERYTPQRLDAACQRALEVDLIDVRRLERILVQALEQEATPQLPLPGPTGRFARPGSVFAHVNEGGQS